MHQTAIGHSIIKPWSSPYRGIEEENHSFAQESSTILHKFDSSNFNLDTYGSPNLGYSPERHIIEHLDTSSPLSQPGDEASINRRPFTHESLLEDSADEGPTINKFKPKSFIVNDFEKKNFRTNQMLKGGSTQHLMN